MDKIKFSDWYDLREAKDACYHKVKKRYRVWPSAYACVPIKTSKALTREGWKTYEELQIGEEILTFSLEKDRLEFKPILNLFNYNNVETYVVKNGNTGWKFECTPNHKWVIKYPKCIGTRGRKKYNDIVNDMRLVSIEDLLSGCGSNRKIVISSKYHEGEPVSLDKIYKYQTNWIEYILSCSPEQRESWLYSAIIYDGNQIKTQRLTVQKNESNHEYLYDTPYGKQSFGFKQKDINHRDAFLLSAFLNKGLVTFKKHKNADLYGCHYVAYNGTKSLQNFKLVEKRHSDVWCPQTENGTWVMMQETDGNGLITITGNSGALVKCRKVGAANWGNSKNESTHECSFCTNPATQIEMWDEEVPVCDECSAGISEGTFDLEKKRGLKGWFDRNKGKGWIDCKASKKGKLVPCGRSETGRGAERAYPACRPTLSACNKSKHKKKSSKSISWRTRND